MLYMLYWIIGLSALGSLGILFLTNASRLNKELGYEESNLEEPIKDGAVYVLQS